MRNPQEIPMISVSQEVLINQGPLHWQLTN